MKTAAAGSVALVGAGPVDPELLSLKALRAICNSAVLLVEDLVAGGVLRFARRPARVVHVGKRGGYRSKPQAFIEPLMLRGRAAPVRGRCPRSRRPSSNR